MLERDMTLAEAENYFLGHPPIFPVHFGDGTSMKFLGAPRCGRCGSKIYDIRGDSFLSKVDEELFLCFEGLSFCTCCLTYAKQQAYLSFKTGELKVMSYNEWEDTTAIRYKSRVVAFIAKIIYFFVGRKKFRKIMMSFS